MNILKFMYSVGVMTKLRKISASYCSESVRNKRPSTLLTYEGFLKTSFFLARHGLLMGGKSISADEGGGGLELH